MNHDHTEECIFCAALQQNDGLENQIIRRETYSFVILNRFPYNNGHLMVVPFDHQPSLDLLSPNARQEIMELTSQTLEVLRLVYQPQGFNIGVNIGAAAGAGVAEHVHVHILPRWTGDTNFMTAVAETRVIPEDLGSTYQRIAAGWQKIFPK